MCWTWTAANYMFFKEKIMTERLSSRACLHERLWFNRNFVLKGIMSAEECNRMKCGDIFLNPKTVFLHVLQPQDEWIGKLCT